MPHDDLTADDVLDLVDEHLPAATQARKKSESVLGFVLYDAIAVQGAFDDYGRGNWGFSIALGGDAMVSRVLGRRLTLCGTRDEVRAALEVIDQYARLRLGSEFLAAYEAASSR
jgi:hypothetical protein